MWGIFCQNLKIPEINEIFWHISEGKIFCKKTILFSHFMVLSFLVCERFFSQFIQNQILQTWHKFSLFYTKMPVIKHQGLDKTFLS
jgi:hypothetical protein